MRNASGSKFSLGSAFGRKTERKQSYSGNDFGQPDSPGGPGGYGGFGNNANSNHPTHGHPQGYSHAGNGNTSDDPGSPNVSGAGATFDGFGKKLGKTFAHQSLLPSLGNKDQRALQDVISAEKGVLNSVERLANESSKAAASLPPYGLQEGPDLHDILQQSSVLLTHLSSSMTAFAERQTSLRGCYKRIREREELLSDLRSRRRATGNKAETAEKKLAKMGPENKQLPSQTELLESLRQQMRSIDTEIVNEESKIGDFKRQSVKEALSYKFAGLEELGEKLCIIGELGKLVIEEIPLDETPAGYGRAPYNGFAKTESAVDEAGRCLSQVKFNPATFELKPSHLPRTSHTLGRETLPAQETLAAAEEYGHVPPPAGGPGGIGGYDNRSQPPGVGPNGASGPHVQGQGQGNGNGNRVGFALDDNPYGGLDGRYTSDNHAYREYGGTRSDDPNAPGNSGPGGNQVVWQGPTEEALARQNQTHSQLPHTQGRGQGYDDRKPSLGPVASTIPHTQNAGEGADGQVHDYEYEQQAEMDRQHREEEAAWQEQARAQDAAQQQQGGHSRELAIGEVMHNPYDAPYAGGGGGGKTQPLNIRRGERGQSPAAQNTPLPAPGVYVNAHSNTNANEGEYNYGSEAHHTGGYDNNAPSQALQESPIVDAATAAAITALAPPPSFAQMGRASPSIGDSGTEGFRTPAESPAMLSSDHVGGLGAPQHSSDQHQVGGGDGPSGVPVIALAPEQEFGVGGGDGSAQRGSSPLPPVPGISDIPPAGRGPSPRPLPEPGIGVAAPPQAGYASAIPPPSPSASTAAYSPTGPTGGKISAGAFRKAQPRRSDLGAAPITAGGLDDGPQGVGSGFGGGEGSRRLPVPPGQPGTQGAPQLNAQGWADEKKALGEQIQAQQREQEQRGAFEDAPPGYSRGEDSLR